MSALTPERLAHLTVGARTHLLAWARRDLAALREVATVTPLGVES